MDGVIAAALDRLAYDQRSRVTCMEPALAMRQRESAVSVLDGRTKDREARGVEGTHAVCGR